MWTTRKIIALVTGLIGALLIVRGLWGGVWPPSLQLVGGLLLVVIAALRWRMLR